MWEEHKARGGKPPPPIVVGGNDATSIPVVCAIEGNQRKERIGGWG